MQRKYHKYRGKRQYIYLLGIIFFSCISIAYTSHSIKMASARTLTRSLSSIATSNCSNAAIPDANSLLIVLLDRSGSLVVSPATDPDDYSTSSVKALADLWPGKMAVIPFGSDAAPILGPYAVSDIHERALLKSQIPEPDPNADTPLGLAMEHAQQVFQQQGVTACSKVVLITDGQPTGPQGRANDVRNTFIPWFRDQGIPINVFGLKIDKNSSDGKAADDLLTAIAQGTGAGPTYDSVQNAKDLAIAVVSLFSSWRHLDFTEVQQDTVDGNYHVSVDQFVHDTAYIITFHSGNISNKPLTTASGNIVSTNTVEVSGQDRHYEIDRLLPPVLANEYIVNTNGDPQAYVYKLVSSTLLLEGIGPTISTQAETSQSLPIQVRFVDGAEPQHPKPGDAEVTASVTEVVNGTSMDLGTVKLTQNQPGDDVFSGYINIPSETFGHKPGSSIGTIQIKINGTYLGATRTAVFPDANGSSISIPLLIPKIQPPPAPKCPLSAAQCFLQGHVAQVITFAIVGLLVLALLLLVFVCLRQPIPTGKLSDVPVPAVRRPGNRRQTFDDDSNHFTVVLGTGRSSYNNIFHRSVISSEEIRRYPDANGNFNPLPAQFDLVATCKKCKQGKQRICLKEQEPEIIDEFKVKNCRNLVHIRRVGELAEITIKSGNRILPVDNYCVPLETNDIIQVDGNDIALYS